MFILLLAAPLAGCAGSDGDVNVDLTTEEIQGLIDDNIDDFLNNTTVTVVNHYHNNTTVDNSGDSTSSTTYNYNGSAASMLKSSSGTMAGVETVVNYPIGAALIVREANFGAAEAGNSAAGLDGANICVGIGTALEHALVDWFSANNISFTSVPVADSAEATAKLIDGSCDAMVVSSVELAEEKKNQLDNDGSISGGTWVTTLYAGASETPGKAGNSISISISQSDDELIALVYLYSQVTLYGNCADGSVGCSPAEHTSIPTDFTLTSTCSDGVSFNNSGQIHYEFLEIYSPQEGDRRDGRLPGTGLSCTHSIHFDVEILMGNFLGYDADAHELSWGDWVYSAVWETTPIQ